jgi:hypothetical protein
MIDYSKTIQTLQIINNVIKTGRSSSKTIVKVFEKPPPPPPTCPSGQHYDSATRKCVKDIIRCIDNPNVEGCEPIPPPLDPCEEDPDAEGCEDPEPIEDPGNGDDGDDGGDDGDDGGGDEEG